MKQTSGVCMSLDEIRQDFDAWAQGRYVPYRIGHQDRKGLHHAVRFEASIAGKFRVYCGSRLVCETAEFDKACAHFDSECDHMGPGFIQRCEKESSAIPEILAHAGVHETN